MGRDDLPRGRATTTKHPCASHHHGVYDEWKCCPPPRARERGLKPYLLRDGVDARDLLRG